MQKLYKSTLENGKTTTCGLAILKEVKYMEIQLGVIEARYADMIWEHESVTSSELVKMTAAEFLESCVPETRKFYDINIIINQEVEAMLAEGKSAAETAKIIDNRVQIYLDENK